jgi:ParB family chromosome partitioning protein
MSRKDFTEQALQDFRIPAVEEETPRKGIRAGTRGLHNALARLVAIERIKPDPAQVRKKFDPEKLEELAESIREKGVLHPIVVEYVEDEDCFQILSGERRYRAAKMAGLEEIPCIILDRKEKLTEYERLEQQLTENIQREDLDPVDQAYAIKRLIDVTGLTQEEVGQKIGKSQEYVAGALKIIRDLPDVIKDDYKDLSREHLLQLARLKDDSKKIELWQRIKQNGMSIRELRAIVNKELKRPPGPKPFRTKFAARDFKISIMFRRQDVGKQEIINALREWIEKLEESA